MALGAVHNVGSQDRGRPRKWSSIPPSVRRSRRSTGPSPWATRSGWTRKTLLGVLAESPDGMTVSGKRPDTQSGTYPPNFTFSLAVEDIHLTTEAAERAGAAP